jgi:hypothetical protein
MKPSPRSKRYVAILLITLVAALSLSFANALFFDRDAIIRCNPDGMDAHTYMAGCSAAYFGDYEHAALFFGLEPEAIAHMKQAQVLVLGNSRAMWAFSTEATDKAFRKLGLSYYVLGFGSDEKMRFASALISRHALKPKAVIIDADPFFVDATNPEYESIIAGRTETLVPNLMRYYIQRWLASWCANPGRIFASSTCKDPALFRSTLDGRWRLQHYTNRTQRNPISPNPDFQMEKTGRFIEAARGFGEQLGLPAECVILTSVPSNLQTEKAAQAIAGAMGWPYLEPKLPDLRTIDDSHLTPESADRWSAALVAEAGSNLSRCTKDVAK